MLRLDFRNRDPRSVMVGEYAPFKAVYDTNPNLHDPACEALQEAKRRACHATAYNQDNKKIMDVHLGKPAAVCTPADTDEELLAKEQAFSKCYNMRKIENTSLCFPEVDAGHAVAQVFDDQNAYECAEIQEQRYVDQLVDELYGDVPEQAHQGAWVKQRRPKSARKSAHKSARKSARKSKHRESARKSARKSKHRESARKSKHRESARKSKRREYVLVIPKK
jgi:hypothetical protein